MMSLQELPALKLQQSGKEDADWLDTDPNPNPVPILEGTCTSSDSATQASCTL